MVSNQVAAVDVVLVNDWRVTFKLCAMTYV
jgi:hypothetical protein